MTASDLAIRALADDDLRDALALSAAVGWNQRLDDWRMLLRLAPTGSVAACSAGRVVGTAIGIDYGGFGWIAMMLVEPGFRGRGVGRSLLEAALDALPHGIPVRLDATPLGRPLYARYGFADEAILTRHVVEAPDVPAPSLRLSDGESAPTQRLTADALARVIELDRGVFGGDRAAVLAWCQDQAPSYAVVSADPGQAGYCFGRRGRLFDQIGPVVAGNDDMACRLVDDALSAAGGRSVIIDAFDSSARFAAWLATRGFHGQRPLFRMRRPAGHRGSPAGPGSRRAPSEFAILGPEFA